MAKPKPKRDRIEDRKRVLVRLNASEHARIKLAARESGQTMTDYIAAAPERDEALARTGQALALAVIAHQLATVTASLTPEQLQGSPSDQLAEAMQAETLAEIQQMAMMLAQRGWTLAVGDQHVGAVKVTDGDGIPIPVSEWVQAACEHSIRVTAERLREMRGAGNRLHDQADRESQALTAALRDAESNG